MIDFQPMVVEVASRKMLHPKSKKCDTNLLYINKKQITCIIDKWMTYDCKR